MTLSVGLRSRPRHTIHNNLTKKETESGHVTETRFRSLAISNEEIKIFMFRIAQIS